MMKCWIILLCTLFQTVSGFSLVVPSASSSTSTSTISSRISSGHRQTTKKGLSFSSLAARQDDDEEFARVPRSRRRGERFFDEKEETEYYDRDDEDWDDEEEDDDDDDDDEEEFGLFSDVLIDNPLLDSIDPDGAAERFPELARDPQFWLDMVLFIAFLNWLSDVGPQDYFPDIPYYV
jgi:hypothetical protein